MRGKKIFDGKKFTITQAVYKEAGYIGKSRKMESIKLETRQKDYDDK